MNNVTLIKAIVAASAVASAVFLSDNDKFRKKFGKAIDVMGDVEKAIKNPLGSLASSLGSSAPSGREMGYYEYQNNESQRRWEMKKLEMQYKHDEEMAKLQTKEEEKNVQV